MDGIKPDAGIPDMISGRNVWMLVKKFVNSWFDSVSLSGIGISMYPFFNLNCGFLSKSVSTALMPFRRSSQAALSRINCPAAGWTANCPRGPPVLSNRYSSILRTIIPGAGYSAPFSCEGNTKYAPSFSGFWTSAMISDSQIPITGISTSGVRSKSRGKAYSFSGSGQATGSHVNVPICSPLCALSTARGALTSQMYLPSLPLREKLPVNC
mmetsp:Transcript_99462/g.259337  ORF Transcript_99462/g.259337 Transcript_99462/m.259337 type:complete len:211 (+) Transcript_99462:96-728(+)